MTDEDLRRHKVGALLDQWCRERNKDLPKYLLYEDVLYVICDSINKLEAKV